MGGFDRAVENAAKYNKRFVSVVIVAAHLLFPLARALVSCSSLYSFKLGNSFGNSPFPVDGDSYK